MLSHLIKLLMYLLLCSRSSSSVSMQDELAFHRMNHSDHFEMIRRNIPLIRNKTLTVCVIVREPFVIYNDPDEVLMDTNETRSSMRSSMRSSGKTGKRSAREAAIGELDNYSGVAIEVIKRLRTIFKFKIKIIRPTDNEFGVLTPERGWTGMMGSLVRKESDVGATALSITVNRAQVVDFTRAYYVETAAILLRIPEEVKNYFAIFEPFEFNVWILLLTTVLSLIFLMTVMSRLEEQQHKQERIHKLISLMEQQQQQHRDSSTSLAENTVDSQQATLQFQHRLSSLNKINQEQSSKTWTERFYYATSCVLNILLIRDIREPPKQTPIRILVCVWWLSTIVIVNIYFGILFGQLVIPRRPRSIESLDELVNQREVEWCVTSGTGMYELFKASPPETIYGQLGRRMRNVSSADEGVERVARMGWAFIRERSMLTFKVAQEHNRMRACRMQLAREEFFSVGFGLALTKNSPYLKPFNSALTLLIESGFVSRWQAQYWPTRNEFTECKIQPLREGDSLSMKHFISIYLVCALILLVAFTILLYQTLARCKRAISRRQNKRSKEEEEKEEQGKEHEKSKQANNRRHKVIKFDEPEEAS